MSDGAAPLELDSREPGPNGVFWGYSDLALFLGLVLPSILAAAAVTRLVFHLVGGLPKAPAVMVLIPQFLAYALLFLSLFLIFKLKYGQPFWRSIGFIRPPFSYYRPAAMGPVLALAVALGSLLLRTPEMDNPMQQLLKDPISIALVGLFAVTLGPLCEELIFRGFLQPLLQRTVGIPAGIFVASLLFSLMHGPQYAWSWRHVILLTAASAVFGWLRYKSGSTSAAALMHATYNLTFFTVFLLGKDLPGQW